MAAIDLHEARALLGVGRDATPDEIRRAYRSRARTHHPDAGGDAATFQALTAAVDLLLDDSDRRPRWSASPSTGRRAYPSTAGGDDDRAARADLALLDDATVPGPGEAWSPAGVAAAVLAALEAAGDDAPATVRGVSRAPRSLLNRFSRHLSDDLLSSWEVGGASDRGRPGVDLEVVATFPPSGRKRVARVRLPSGWSTTRNPAGTESTYVVRPTGDAATTAVVVAEVLDEFCHALDWPLSRWLRAT